VSRAVVETVARLDHSASPSGERTATEAESSGEPG